MLRTGCVIDLTGVSQLRQLVRANGSGLRIGAAVTARALERDPGVSAAYPGDRRERRAGGVGPGAEPGDAGRQSLQRGALGRHGAAARGAGRRGRDRGAQGHPARAVRLLLPRRAPHGARAGRAAGGDRRAAPGPRTAAGTTCGTRRGASSTSRSSAWRPSSRCRRASARRRGSPWRRWRRRPVRATGAEQVLEGQPVTPELIERAARAAVEAARPISDQRGSADFRRHLVQRPDPPHAHHRARARERLTIAEGLTCPSRS